MTEDRTISYQTRTGKSRTAILLVLIPLAVFLGFVILIMVLGFYRTAAAPSVRFAPAVPTTSPSTP